MSRRNFIRKILAGLKTLAVLQLMPASPAMAAIQRPANNPHYTPLNGSTLQALAAAKTHHGPNGRFINPLGRLQRRSLWEVLHWKLFSENQFKDHLDQQPITQVQVDWPQVKRNNGVSVTFIKHASVLIKDGDHTIIVDPVFNDMLWFIKDFSPLAFDVRELPHLDHILITHGHYDHLNKTALAALDPRTHVITPLGYDDIFAELKMNHRTQLDWYDQYTDGHWEITLLPCNHWTMRNPITGPNHSLWGSYMVKTPSGKTIYLSGDTAYFDGFNEIGSQFDIDLAILNLGAYEPRWFMAPSHMNPAETVEAFKQLNAKQLMVVHWGSFRLGDEPVHFPPQDLRVVLEEEKLLERWVDIRHGQTHYL
ncbi:MAG: MBL fold metallo-hydrolase [Desulfobacteraceae bacterium]|nr:MBL fold metallo-hydrolase [Desulfobacteraceae bacterium]